MIHANEDYLKLLKMFILVVKSNIHSKIILFRFCYQIKQKKSRAPYFMGFAGLLILFIFNGLKVACAIYSSTNNLYYAFIACLFHIYCFIKLLGSVLEALIISC